MNAASELGKKAAGKPKHYTAAELEKRTERIKSAQKKRAQQMRANDGAVRQSREGGTP